MKTRLGIMLVFLILAGLGFSSQSLNAQTYTVSNWVIAGGGMMSAEVGNGMKMHGTIGQYAAGQFAQGGNKLYVGFWGPTTQTSVSVDDNTPAVPGMSTISNYPNPFSMMTTINYVVPQSAVLTIRVVDMVGREVRMLINNEQAESGNHSIQWDSKDDSGADVGAGNYVCEMSLTVNGEVLKARVPMMLVK